MNTTNKELKNNENKAKEDRALYEDIVRNMFGEDEYLISKHMSEYDNEQT